MRLGQEISCTWSSGTPCGDVCDRIIVVLPYTKGGQCFTSSPKPDELN
jgi:hypothetical protein